MEECDHESNLVLPSSSVNIGDIKKKSENFAFFTLSPELFK